MQRHYRNAYRQPGRQCQYLCVERPVIIIINSTKPDRHPNCHLHVFADGELWQRTTRLQPCYCLYDHSYGETRGLLARWHQHRLDYRHQLVWRSADHYHQRSDTYRRYLLSVYHFWHIAGRQHYHPGELVAYSERRHTANKQQYI